MTSIHMKTEQSPRMTNGTSVVGPNQSQSPSKFDEAERVRQRFDVLRKHHNVSTEIYNRTQPIIDEQIHDETLKYLKSSQVNGTKTKSQKPRAPKRPRTTPNNNNNNNNTTANNNNNTTNNVNNNLITNNHNQLGTGNGNGPMHTTQQHQQVQVIRQQSASSLAPQNQTIVQQGQQMQQIPMYQQHIQGQQQPMHVQQHNYKAYETTNGIYQQSTTPTMQPQQPHYQSQPIYNQQPPPQQPQPQHNLAAPQLIQSTPPHHHSQPIGQGHYIPQQHQPNQQMYATHQSHHMHHHNQGYHQSAQPTQMSHPSYFSSLPNDLDLNIQAGLECDVDSLIHHEMSVEGQLDFNRDLLLKLDNYHYPNQIQQQHHL